MAADITQRDALDSAEEARSVEDKRAQLDEAPGEGD